MKLRNKKVGTFILTVMLIAIMASMTVGCGKEKEGQHLSTEAENMQQMQTEVLGEGQTQFLFTVIDKEGNESAFEIHTDKELVGEALLELGLIAGEEGAYGLYVKTVNEIVADYDTDQTYWAFYVNGEYGTSGVDTTAIEEGMTYTFKVEK